MAEVVKKILDIGLAIKDAVQTARSNERECRGIERVADRVCALVHTLTASAQPMVHDPVVAGTLDAVLDSLTDALKLVRHCGTKNTLLKVITAKSTAKKLARVQNDIMQKISLGTLAVTVVTAVNLSRPQLSVQQPNPVHCSSRLELGLMVQLIYNRQMVRALWAIVTPETTAMVAFASRAAGAQATFLTGPENNILCAIAGYPLNNAIFHDILYPRGVTAFSCFGIAGRLSFEQLCTYLLDFRPLSLLPASNDPPRPQITEITEEDEAGMPGC